jgi:hypothetical protein
LNSTPNTRAAPTQTIELHYSRWVVLLSTAALAAVAVWASFWVVVGFASGRSIAFVVGLIALLFGLPVLLAFAPPLVRAWRHRGPVVVMNAEGVTDIRKKVAFIPWTDIGQVNLGVGNNSHFLCFEFRKPDSQRQDTGSPGWLGTIVSRTRSLSDWNISLRLLVCRKQEVLKIAKRLHQQRVREQVVALNNGRSGGWSGTL